MENKSKKTNYHTIIYLLLCVFFACLTAANVYFVINGPTASYIELIISAILCIVSFIYFLLSRKGTISNNYITEAFAVGMVFGMLTGSVFESIGAGTGMLAGGMLGMILGIFPKKKEQ